MEKILKISISAAATAAIVIGLGAVAQSASASASPAHTSVASVAKDTKEVLPQRFARGGWGGGGWGGGGTGGSTNGISYHSGPVMTAGVKVYPIWYGTFSDSSKAIINGFLNSLGGSPYFNINTSYYNASNVKVLNSITVAAPYLDAAESLGASLTDANVATLAGRAITANGGTVDPKGIYLVLTAADVKETSGFVTTYCGWHNYATTGTAKSMFAFVGDATTQGLAHCATQTTTSPNNNPGADAMVSVIAHEIEETATDPQLNGWYDSTGNENGDKCAWNYGTTSTATNGSKYNVTLGTTQYYIQQNWLNANGGSCVLSY